MNVRATRPDRGHRMFMRRGLFCLMFVLLAAGCEEYSVFDSLADKNSHEAQIEKARIAMDEGDYARALNILEEMDPNHADVRKYTSAAWAGMAGVDAVNLLKHIEEINESQDAGAVSLVNRILRLGDVSLTRDEGVQKIQYLDNAIGVLFPFPNSPNAQAKDSPETDGSNRVDLDTVFRNSGVTNDQLVQLGVFCLTQGILIVADLIMNDIGDELLEQFGSIEIELTEQGLRSHYRELPFPRDSATADRDYDRYDRELSRNVFLIETSIGAISDILGGEVGGHNVRDAFEDFLATLNPDNDREISMHEIAAFVNSL